MKLQTEVIDGHHSTWLEADAGNHFPITDRAGNYVGSVTRIETDGIWHEHAQKIQVGQVAISDYFKKFSDGIIDVMDAEEATNQFSAWARLTQANARSLKGETVRLVPVTSFPEVPIEEAQLAA